MTQAPTSRAARDAVGLELGPEVADTLRARLPLVAEETVAAITAEVPSYEGALSGEMGAKIENAVELALAGFLSLVTLAERSDPSTPLDPVLEGAYALGRGEARSGRSMDALLSAYRVGARVSWRELSGTAVGIGLRAETMAKFAELVFAYIDELSAASVAGHADELATSGRVRRRYLERLGQALLAGAAGDVLVADAERADWTPPRTLTAVLVPATHVRGAVSVLAGSTLEISEDLPGIDPTTDVVALLVPDMEGAGRPHLLRLLGDRQAVVGPARPWTQVRSSYHRARRTLEAVDAPRGVVDTEEHLTELILAADPEALADLRAQVLAPLDDLRAATAERLAETLRSWLLHHGRREDVAADLVVHPQTVRYRMGQLREVYGDRLDDPRTVLALTLALAAPGSP